MNQCSSVVFYCYYYIAQCHKSVGSRFLLSILRAKHVVLVFEIQREEEQC